ncbi:hypothetical protein M758_5G159900 [Ceratodon purpureus]|nr:hypothetical protein M758_5G159900 [Ceratodon purpureus]
MAHVEDHSATGAAPEEHSHGAEHTSFLHKLKEKLHIGSKHKDEKVADSGEAPASATATHDAPVVSKSTSDDQVSSTPVAKPVDVVAPLPATTTAAPEEHAHHDSRPTAMDVSSLAGHESEHHGGVPTFLAALPDQDVPALDSPAHPQLHHVAPDFDSEQAKQGEHHGRVPEDGVPTFLAALPDRDIPAEDSPRHPQLHHGTPGSASHFDSKEVQQGEHHAQDSPTHKELHHVEQGEHHQGGAPHLDSEQVFEQAQQGEHHHGVPTFLVALPDEEIPAEVTKSTSEAISPEHQEPHRGHHAHGDEQFDSEEVFQDAQQGEHHHGVPTFLVALPDEEIPVEVTKGVESTTDESVTEGSMSK